MNEIIMRNASMAGLFLVVLLLLLLHLGESIKALNVSYDHRCILLDGHRRILISGSIHYPRSTPQMWPDLIAKAKDGGLDVIDTYVFWNVHEPTKRKYNFKGRFDLVQFVKEVHRAGLFLNLRVGPFISAEWNFAGIPAWLHLEPRLVFRMDNVPFKKEMQIFVGKIVDMMKQEQLFAWQGGPIILTQIENEFGFYPIGTPQHAYAMWSAKMALAEDTGVPLTMCLQYDAPDPVINTFNSYYADDFFPNGADKPKMWTEDWTGWFQTYGVPTPYRPVEDLAYAVARFFQKGGTFQNYYMYHGGTNFGRTSGGPFITTSYDYDAPLDEYGLIRQPKWGHLRDLHQALKLCEPALISGDATRQIWLGPKQEAFIYSNETEGCSAFLSNSDLNDTTVQFNGRSYFLPAWSVSILPDCKAIAFNTAKVSSQSSLMTMRPVSISSSLNSSNWQWYSETPGIWDENIIESNYLMEQISTTKDKTDYLWYITSVQVSEDEPFLKNGSKPVLQIDSMRDAVHLFINKKYIVSAAGNWQNMYLELIQPIDLHKGSNEIAILSMTVGLQSGGAGYDLTGTGIQGSVYVNGFKNGSIDISEQRWLHQVGMEGENLGIYTKKGSENVQWSSGMDLLRNQSLTWYKTSFDAPSGNDPVVLDLSTMGKGQAWVNGQSIGRFWPSYITSTTACSSACDYRGTFNSTKCVTNCGQQSQRWYHVPRSWLKTYNNLLVLFEEVGGDPMGISLATRVVDKICTYVSEDFPLPLNSWSLTGNEKASLNQFTMGMSPEATLQCDKGKRIASIQFASYGTPQGTCGNFQRALCHAENSRIIIEKACIGRRGCSVKVSSKIFGDECPEETKSLAIEAECA